MNEQEIIEYCLSFPDAYEDYSFGGAWTAIRHRANRKGFAFLFQQNDKLCVNLRCPPFKADFLRQVYRDVAPGYRMNKDYWNMVTVGGDVQDQDLRDMIDESYRLIKPKQKRAVPKQEKPQVVQIHWPETLYRAVFGLKDAAVPDNAEEAAKHALSKLKAREQAMILARFRDKKIYATIGAEHGISNSRASQIVDRALRKLRNPRRSRYLTHLDQALESDHFAETTSPEERREMLINRHGAQHIQALESLDISELGLGNMAYNRLLLNGIHTLADLAMLTLPELLNLRFLGTEAYGEIMDACKKNGIRIMADEELSNNQV